MNLKWLPGFEEGDYLAWTGRKKARYTVQTFETLILKDIDNMLDTVQAWADRSEYAEVTMAAARAAELIRQGTEPRNVRVVQKVAEFNPKHEVVMIH